MSKLIWVIAGVVLALVAFLTVRSFQNPMMSQTAQTAESTINISKGTSVNSENGKWHEFTSPNKEFTVLLPALPQHATEKQHDPSTQQQRHYDMYVSEADNGTIYMISLIKNSEKNNKIDEAVLKKVMNEMIATNPSNKIKKMEMGKYKENPAMDFSIEQNEINIQGKAFTSDNILYVLTSVTKGKTDPAEFNFFVNSFEIIPTIEKK